MIPDDAEKPSLERFAVLSCGDRTVLGQRAVRGSDVFTGKGRCVSCHIISQKCALFTDNRFHNSNAGFQRIGADVGELANVFPPAKAEGTNGDIAILSDQNTSEADEPDRAGIRQIQRELHVCLYFRFGYTE